MLATQLLVLNLFSSSSNSGSFQYYHESMLCYLTLFSLWLLSQMRMLLNHPLKRLISLHFWRAMAFRLSNFKCYFCVFVYSLILVISNQLLYCFPSRSQSVAVLSILVICFYHLRVLHFKCFICTIGNK